MQLFHVKQFAFLVVRDSYYVVIDMFALFNISIFSPNMNGFDGGYCYKYFTIHD